MRVERLSVIAADVDGVLIDQFGVIHDGRTLYPGALDVLQALKARRTPVAVLTNSGKRAAANRDRLVRMGVPRDAFTDVVSSGEVAWKALRAATPMPRAWVIGRSGEDYGFEGVPVAEAPQMADLILILGSNAPETTLDEYRDRFRGLTLPALCCNPDLHMLTANGLQPGPGAIAKILRGTRRPCHMDREALSGHLRRGRCAHRASATRAVHRRQCGP